jgi:hypothetical protein
MTIKVLALLCVILGASVRTQSPSWRGIVPLRSTREDVERLIGPPMAPGGITYDLKDERVNVSYSAVPCAKGWPYGWNVPPGTVVSIEIFPKVSIKLSDLDLANYTKFTNPLLPDEVHYNNTQEGRSIRTEGGSVVSFEYFPAARDRGLMCPAAAERALAVSHGQNASRLPITYYSHVSISEEHTRLKVFFDLLKQYSSDSRIYIIGYAGNEACPNEALSKATRAKGYLVKLGVSGQRIVMIDGGYAAPVRTEFYVVAPDQPKPLAHPDIYPGDVHVLAKCGRQE